MPIFIVLGTLAIVTGIVLVIQGTKAHSNELIHGAFGVAVGGIFLIFLALALYLSSTP